VLGRGSLYDPAQAVQCELHGAEVKQTETAPNLDEPPAGSDRTKRCGSIRCSRQMGE